MTTISDKLLQAVSKVVPADPLGVVKLCSPTSVPRLDERLVQFALDHSIGITRVSLAIVFAWFGLLKLVQPASDFGMVIGTTYWFPLSPKFLVSLMGVMEVLIGVAVLFARGALLRLALWVVLLHMLATFVVLFLMPDLVFDNGNPLLLTNPGEYVIKNIVMIAAALVILGSITDLEKNRLESNVHGKRVNGHTGLSREVARNGAQLTGIRSKKSQGSRRQRNRGSGNGGADG